jgi:hypothetical protein
MRQELTSSDLPVGHKPATKPGLVARLARTPLVDLARGRISGRMDARHQSAHAEIPAMLAELVTRTVHGTRLRHREQHAIADELIAQLQDALDAGETVDQLARQFGDPRTAARLLRRACLKRRSQPRRILRRAVQASVAAGLLLALTYAVLVVRHLLSQPTVSRNYLAEINRASQAVPEQDRAWPLYRAALMKLEPFPHDDAELSEQAYLHYWPQIADYLKRNREAFDLARKAADQPRLGFWYGDPADADWLERQFGTRVLPDPLGAPLYTLSAPHLDELARFRRLLLADSRRAIAAGEGRTFVSNIQTLVGLARHLRDDSPLILTELRAFACFGTALQLVGLMLDEQPSLLREEDLVDLAHRIATYSGGGTLRARLDGERLLFEDLLQRIYTDDGGGDGYLTAEGHRIWRRIEGDLPPWYEEPLTDWDRFVEPLSGTTLSLITARRSSTSALAERLVLRFQAERAGPLWEWEESTAETHVEELLASRRKKLEYWPVLYVFPGLRHIALRGEVVTQQRDAILAAIGLELYRRRHGEWPQSLEQLTPFPLPAVPMDRFTGKRLCYRLVDGKPLLYSTGMDRDDDGGRPHRMGNELAERWEPWKRVKSPPRLVNDGFGNLVVLPPKFDWDWILWPAPAPRPESEEDSEDADATGS